MNMYLCFALQQETLENILYDINDRTYLFKKNNNTTSMHWAAFMIKMENTDVAESPDVGCCFITLKAAILKLLTPVGQGGSQWQENTLCRNWVWTFKMNC